MCSYDEEEAVAFFMVMMMMMMWGLRDEFRCCNEEAWSWSAHNEEILLCAIENSNLERERSVSGNQGEVVALVVFDKPLLTKPLPLGFAVPGFQSPPLST
jgi:hypothetical protein